MASDEQIMAMMDSGVYVPSAQAAAVRARCEAKESRADSSAVASARCTARVHADEDEPEFAASDARPLQSLRWFKAKHTGAKRKQGDALAAAVGTAELGGVEDFRSTVRLPTGAGERAGRWRRRSARAHGSSVPVPGPSTGLLAPLDLDLAAALEVEHSSSSRGHDSCCRRLERGEGGRGWEARARRDAPPRRRRQARALAGPCGCRCNDERLCIPERVAQPHWSLLR